MAIRYRKGKRSPWQVYWNNPHTGERESKSFATEKEAKKEDAFIKYRLEFDKDSFPRELKANKRKREESTASGVSLEYCWLAYIKEKQFGLTSIAAQKTSLRIPFAEWQDKAVEDIHQEDLEHVCKLITAQPIKETTKRLRLSHLRVLLGWCVEQGYMEKLNFPKLPQGKCKHFIPPTLEEIRAIMANARPHMQRLCVLGAYFGVRVGPSEAFKLTWDDVDFEQGVLRVHGAKKNKANPWREVPIPSNLIATLKQWEAEDTERGTCRHILQLRGKPLTCIQKEWCRVLQKAGITRRIRPYDLRHAFATNAIAAGADIGTVAQLMGHANPMMILKHYQHVMTTQKKRAMEQLPNFLHVPASHVPKNEQGDMLN